MGKRRRLDFYETNASAVRALRERVTISGLVCEPCNGLGAISRLFPDCELRTNDIDVDKPADTHFDATLLDVKYWQDFQRQVYAVRDCPFWVVTNPPFSHGLSIVRPIVEAGISCAFLLRLSFLEPTRDPADRNYRGPFLAANPPQGLIVLPRYSYTGDGKTDSVTSAWFLWNLPTSLQPAIQAAPLDV